MRLVAKVEFICQTVEFAATALVMDLSRMELLESRIMFVDTYAAIYNMPVNEPDVLGFVKPFTGTVSTVSY